MEEAEKERSWEASVIQAGDWDMEMVYKSESRSAVAGRETSAQQDG
jgi:hypothetical protein